MVSIHVKAYHPDIEEYTALQSNEDPFKESIFYFLRNPTEVRTHDYSELYSICKDLLANVFDSILNKVRFKSFLSVIIVSELSDFLFTPGTNVTQMSNAQHNSRPQPRRRAKAMSQSNKIHISGNSKPTAFGGESGLRKTEAARFAMKYLASNGGGIYLGKTLNLSVSRNYVILRNNSREPLHKLDKERNVKRRSVMNHLDVPIGNNSRNPENINVELPKFSFAKTRATKRLLFYLKKSAPKKFKNQHKRRSEPHRVDIGCLHFKRKEQVPTLVAKDRSGKYKNISTALKVLTLNAETGKWAS
ncbi:hypothetical protein Tco_1120071 [Tanacetum coccineum]